MTERTDYPSFLVSQEALQQHFRAQLEGLNSTEKGQRFARFVERLIPQTDFGSNFTAPVLSERAAADGGVDLSGRSRLDDSMLFIQAKLWVDKAETVDSVISKFEAFTTTSKDGQLELLDVSSLRHHFALVTLSPLDGIIERYEKKNYSSKQFYDRCKAENRIHFVDIRKIFAILRTTYSKITQLPPTIDLNSVSEFIHHDNVYVGILSSNELKRLYSEFGDSLFFENVRDFLGVPRNSDRSGRTTPNGEIVKTVATEPEKMLSRNNGVVFGAREVESGDSAKQLILKAGSVVNGCQTTMCIVEAATLTSYVMAKVVQTEDAWDITKAANFQTSVPDIDLELARYLRPQLIKRAAISSNVRLDDRERSAFQILDAIYDRRVAYDETRLLYIGLFSRSPNNVFASNYTELLQDLIANLYSIPSFDDDLFDALFSLQYAAQSGLALAKRKFTNPAYAANFERLYKPDSLPYRCFLSILAICGTVGINIAERELDASEEVRRVQRFLQSAQHVLRNKEDLFVRYFQLAVKLWMMEVMMDEDDSELRRDMYVKSKRANFTLMYRKLCMEADMESNPS